MNKFADYADFHGLRSEICTGFNMHEILEKVYEFAARSHGEQRRKFVDELYIHHPVRVMELSQEYNKTIPVAAAALLHAVLEDTEVTADQLRDFLNEVMSLPDARHTMMLVRDLTDIYTKDGYPSWNRRRRKKQEAERLSKTHPDSQTIKYADIIDNSNDIAGSGDDFALKFLEECRELLKKIRSGNQELYTRAVSAVDAALRKLEV